MYTQDRLGNCIYLHSFTNKIDTQVLFEYIESFFIKCDITPTHMGYDSQHLPRSKSAKTFKHGKKSLYKIDFKDVESFSIHASAFEFYHMAHTFISGSYLPESICPQFSLIFDEDICSFSVQLINTLIKEISIILKPKYGYFLQKNFLSGPILYDSGIIYGEEETFTEAKKMTQWQHARYHDGKYKIGKLRDIYCCNVIGDVHLNEPALGTTLGQWIQSDASHGTLTPLTPELYAWWVEPEQIEPIRHALKDTGLIICDYGLNNLEA